MIVTGSARAAGVLLVFSSLIVPVLAGIMTLRVDFSLIFLSCPATLQAVPRGRLGSLRHVQPWTRTPPDELLIPRSESGEESHGIMPPSWLPRFRGWQEGK